MDQTDTPAAVRHTAGFGAARWARLRSPMLLLGLLAGQFALVQLLTGVQFGDATRNMHWGVLSFEQPGFLLGQPDTGERIKGFPPVPPELGPLGRWDNTYGSLHRWWGPLPPLLFAAVWALTRSYTLLQLVMPLAGAATVLLTYALARDTLGPRRALLAAAFLACYPIFREYSSVAYTEALSALALTAAFLAYLRGRTALTVIAGALACLSKLDMLGIYAGVIAVCAAWSVLRRDRSLPLAHHCLSLVGPLLLASPWIWLHYLSAGQGAPTQPLSLALFQTILPMMLDLTFYAPWYICLITLAAIAAPVLAGLRARTLPALTTLLLGSWIGLGLLVTLVYCATPGAGNSPRVIIPALPALALLFAAGFDQLRQIWRRRIAIYLIALFTVVDLVVIGYGAVSFGVPIRNAGPAFAILRGQERGFVLTPLYWETILYTRQPATWFEADLQFQRNIMDDPANFARYVGANPIRYVLLPDDDPAAASPAVRAYLAAHAQASDSGAFTLYTLAK